MLEMDTCVWKQTMFRQIPRRGGATLLLLCHVGEWLMCFVCLLLRTGQGTRPPEMMKTSFLSVCAGEEGGVQTLHTHPALASARSALQEQMQKNRCF